MNLIQLLLPGLLLTTMMTAVHAVDADPAQQQAPAAENAPVEQAEEAPTLTFDIWEFELRGNTVMDVFEVEKAVSGYLGPGRTVDDVDAAANALQSAYKANGYPTVLVNVPQQQVAGGIVILDIIEGKIGRLKVSGSRYFSLTEIKAMVPSLARGIVPHLPTVQQELRDVNTSSADLRVTPIFRPGRLPGTVSVELKVKDDSPFHGSLEVNGRNTSSTTRTRLVANLSYANLWLKNHTASITYQTSPEDTDEVKVIVASYTIPFGDDVKTSDRLAMYAVKSDSKTGVATGGDISVVGDGKIFGARWVKPLEGRDTWFHSIVFGFDYKDFLEEVAQADSDSLLTPIDYTLFSIDYNATSLTASTTTSYKAGIKMAPRALFGNDPEEFDNKRIFSNPNFSIINLEVNSTYRFDNGFALAWSVSGQLANQPVISNEQFSVGGAETVRGYFESQLLADDALATSIEVHSPNLSLLTKRGFKDAYAMAFFDSAATRLNEPLDQEETSQIYSVGVGLRAATSKSFELEVDVATPLKSNGSVEKNDARVHFLLRGSF